MPHDDITQKQQHALRQKLEALTLEHRDLDDLLEVARNSTAIDAIKIQRMKKRKLAIKDEIRAIHSRLLPDIIA